MSQNLADFAGRPLTVSEKVYEATAGFYDESGDWMYTASLPAKTGVGVFGPNPE